MKFKVQTEGHTHQGVKVSAGDTIEVTPSTADWLTKQKVGVVVPVENVSKGPSNILSSKGD